jgi:heptosyltransferase III
MHAATRLKILVIRRDNIGDLVCTTPLISALRERHPEAWIAALVNRYAAPILERNADLDAVFSYRKAKHRARGETVAGLYWERLRTLLGLRRRRIDYVVLAAPALQAGAERLARMVRPAHVVGFDHSRIADLRVPSQSDRVLHQVESVFRLARAFGIEGPPPPLSLAPDPALAARYAARLPVRNGPVVGVHISAREADRRWPDARYAQLIGALLARHDATVVMTWSPGARDNPLFPGDDESARDIAAHAGGDARLLALPTRDLAELVAGIAVCDYVVCSDGAAVHIASALGKPVVALFGGEDPRAWHPWGVSYRLLRPESRDVRDIEVEEVRRAFAELWGRDAL